MNSATTADSVSWHSWFLERFLPRIYPPFVVFLCLVSALNYLFIYHIYFGDKFYTHMKRLYNISVPVEGFDDFIFSLLGFEQPTGSAEKPGTWSDLRSRHPVLSQYTLSLYLDFCAIFSVVPTYWFGVVFHGNSGWNFFQYFRGGVGFMILQTGTWSCLLAAVTLPWFANRGLHLPSPRYKRNLDPVENDIEFGAFALLGALFSLSSLTFAFLSVIAFDKKAKCRLEKLGKVLEKLSSKITSQEKQKLKLRKFIKHYQKHPSSPSSLSDSDETGSSEAARALKEKQQSDMAEVLYARTKNGIYILQKLFKVALHELHEQELRVKLVLGDEEKIVFYLFLFLQFIVILYIRLLILLVEDNIIKSTSLQTSLTIHFMILTAINLGLTCACGGKWRSLGRGWYGTFIPLYLEGGIQFLFFHFLGWGAFLSALGFGFAHIVSISLYKADSPTYPTANGENFFARAAGFSSTVSLIFVIISLAVFDKAQKFGVLEQSPTSSASAEKIRDQSTNQEPNALQGLSDILKMEICGAQRRQIFGKEYDYNSWDRFKQDYLEQRNKILENVAKFQPEEIRSKHRTEKSQSQVRHRTNGPARTRGSTRRRQRTRSPGPAPQRSDSPAMRNIVTEEEEETSEQGAVQKSREIWEEYEDENGHVFYYNVTTGRSYQELPQS